MGAKGNGLVDTVTGWILHQDDQLRAFVQIGPPNILPAAQYFQHYGGIVIDEEEIGKGSARIVKAIFHIVKLADTGEPEGAKQGAKQFSLKAVLIDKHGRAVLKR